MTSGFIIIISSLMKCINDENDENDKNNNKTNYYDDDKIIMTTKYNENQ